MSMTLDASLVRPVARDAALDRTEWCLRIGAAACFVGHGAFGILTKQAWLPYFAVVGIGPELAYRLMPIVGAVDVAAGIVVLISPRAIALVYMVAWALWTALLRPLAGESFFETLERAGNFGVPLALLLMLSFSARAGSFIARVGRRGNVDRILVGRVLLGTTSLLLSAHGALQAITRKPSLVDLYASVGIPARLIPTLGLMEMVAGATVLIAPTPALLIAIALWKVATEALFPVSGAPYWEFVERGGSYAAPVALLLLFGTSPFTRITLSRSTR